MIDGNVFTTGLKPLALGVVALAVALAGASAQASIVVYNETFDTTADQALEDITNGGWDGWAGGSAADVDETDDATSLNSGNFTQVYNRNGGTGGLATNDSIRHDAIDLTAGADQGLLMLFTNESSFDQSFTSAQLESIEFDASANNAFTMRALVHVDVSNDGIRDDNEWYVSDAVAVEPTAGGFNGSGTTISVDQTLNPDWTQVDLNPGTTLGLTANVGSLPGGNVLAVGFYTDEGDFASLLPDSGDDRVGGPDNNAKYAVDNYTVTIPEPASMALLAAGVGMMLGRRRG